MTQRGSFIYTKKNKDYLFSKKNHVEYDTNYLVCGFAEIASTRYANVYKRVLCLCASDYNAGYV